MKSLTDCFKLSNGVEIPCIGFGTWQTPDGEVCVSSVKEAVACGYRHIDTATAYGNEASVGRGIAECGVPRKDLFITTKLWNTEHGYDRTMAAFEKSMKDLGLETLDLYLIHWPNPIDFRDHWQEANAGTWKAFEELYAAGKIRAIGVSNFMIRHMEELLKTATVVPMVNQIFLCPGETQDELAKYCGEKNILLQAYSPLGNGKIFDVPEVRKIAEKYGKTVAQVCIRWSLQRGYNPLPKSVTASRIKENTQVFDFELSGEDVSYLAGLKGICGEQANPDDRPF